jgi:hypothetical protein
MHFSPGEGQEIVIGSASGAYVGFAGIDLTGIRRIVFSAIAPAQGLPTAGGVMEVRLGSPDGTLVGTSTAIAPSPGFGNIASLPAEISPTSGKHEVFFVFRNKEAPAQQPIFILLAATFESDAPSSGAVGSAGLSTRSALAVLLGNPKAVDVLEAHMPGFTTDPRLEPAMGMSLQDIAPYAPEVFTTELMSKLEAALTAL